MFASPSDWVSKPWLNCTRSSGVLIGHGACSGAAKANARTPWKVKMSHAPCLLASVYHTINCTLKCTRKSHSLVRQFSWTDSLDLEQHSFLLLLLLFACQREETMSIEIIMRYSLPQELPLGIRSLWATNTFCCCWVDPPHSSTQIHEKSRKASDRNGRLSLIMSYWRGWPWNTF